jgi:hypothetical protein
MKTFLRLLLLVLIVAPVALAWAAIEPAPLVSAEARATPGQVGEARRLLHRFRRATENPGITEIEATKAELDGALALGARLVPGLRGDAGIGPEGVRLRLSAPVPLVPELGWLNAEALVPPYEGAPKLAGARLGAIAPPPDWTLALGRLAADLVLGDGMADKLLESVPALHVEEGRGARAGQQVAVAAIGLDEDRRRGLMRSVAGALRGDEAPRAEEVLPHYLALREAAEAGDLPGRGSLVPYLRLAAGRAADAARGLPEAEARREFAASLFALTRFCAYRGWRLAAARISGDVARDDADDWTRDCERVTLAGRRDSRLHFLTAAALQAASDRRLSFAMGEYKELLDSLQKANGFDFTDIAANAAGIRFAALFQETPPARWPALIARIGDEGALFPPLDGIPGRMKQAEFERVYGDADSPEYMAEVSRIETRIDALPLHAPLPEG